MSNVQVYTCIYIKIKKWFPDEQVYGILMIINQQVELAPKK